MSRTAFDSHTVEELWYNPLWRITTVKLNGTPALLLQLRHPRFGFIDAVIPWQEAQLLSSAMQAAEDASLDGTPTPAPDGTLPQA